MTTCRIAAGETGEIRKETVRRVSMSTHYDVRIFERCQERTSIESIATAFLKMGKSRANGIHFLALDSSLWTFSRRKNGDPVVLDSHFERFSPFRHDGFFIDLVSHELGQGVG